MKLAAAWLGFCVALAGCASTKVETTGPAVRPLCRADATATVVWAPKWRADQKDVEEREAAAYRGIERFFAESRCFAKVVIIRDDGRVLDLGGDRFVAIRVRELGPVVRIGSPVVVEGGTEVVLELKVLDARTLEVLADLRTHWQNGGPGVIKGVAKLDEDMRAALAAVLTF
jgi:hypothetical protein